MYHKEQGMTGSLRERRRQLLRDEILDAAGKLLNQKGYATMSMDELATQVGISKPTLYSYFGTKEELVSEAIIREFERLLALTHPLDPSQTPLQRLTSLLETSLRLQFDEQHQPLRPWMPEMRDLIRNNPRAIECLRSLNAAVGALVQEGMAAGEIDAGLDVPSVVRAFHAMIGSVRLAPLLGAEQPQLSAAIHTLKQMFTRSVRPE